MSIYFDNAATTRPYDFTRLFRNYIESGWYNPSSIYKPSIDASEALNTARMSVTRGINALSGNIVFTSGGTEANNAAIFGCAEGRKRHFITTEVEHSSVYEAFLKLKSKGMSVDFIRPGKDYTIDPKDVINAIREDTALVSIMHVNNETGAINDIYNISKKVKARNPEVLFHSDGVQAFLKMPVYLTSGEIDFYSMSAHKINALKGTGALYIKNANKVKPFIVGGGQEGSLRSGTENTFGIAFLSAAIDEHLRNFEDEGLRIEHISQRLKNSLAKMDDVILNSPHDEKCVPNIINVSILGINAETLLHSLEARGIYIGIGSACSSKKNVGSRILKAQGIADERLKGAIRISLGVQNSIAEADMFLNVIEQEIKILRRFKKR